MNMGVSEEKKDLKENMNELVLVSRMKKMGSSARLLSQYTFWMFIVFLVCLVFYLNSIKVSNSDIETRNSSLLFQYRLSWMTCVIVQQDSVYKGMINNMFATMLGAPAIVMSDIFFKMLASIFFERGIKVITA